MPLAEAQGIAPANPPRSAKRRSAQTSASAPLCAQLHDPAADRAALLQLVEWCERFSPVVGLEESALLPDQSPDTMLADVTGCAHLFGGEDALVRQVVEQLQAQGYRARVALADTIGAAWAVAHFHPHECTVVAPPDTSALLAALPVEALRLPVDTTALLRELGLECIGQLLALDRAELPARFGPDILRRLDEASGQRPEVAPAHRPLPPLQVDFCFESPVERRSVVESALEHMLQRLAAQLAERGQGIEQLECRLYLTTGDCLSLQVGTVRPRSSSGHLLSLVRLQLEPVRLSAPVVAIRVHALLTAPQPGDQQQMFAAGEAQAQRQLGELLERLSGRLGNSAVMRPRLSGDPQPERSCRYEPMVSIERQRGSQRKKTKQQNSSPRSGPAIPLLSRPLRLLARPLPAEVWSVVPDGPLGRFCCQLADERIARSWGPERIETGWWRETLVRRDYYQVETVSGRRYWLFCRLQDRRWFVHGLFE